MRSTYPRIHATLGLVAASLLALTGSLGGQGKDKAKNKDRPAEFTLPLKTGTQWDYRSGAKRVTVRVTKDEEADKEVRATLESSEGGNVVVEKLALRPDGLYRDGAEGLELTPPLCLLKLPPKAGETWKGQSAAGATPVTGTFTAGEVVEVAVPGGKFKAIPVTCPDFRIGGLAMRVECWYAPGVGLVKQRLDVGGREIVLELEKYTPAK